MRDTGLVSIIVPVFNGLPFLKEALESAINQTYTNLEIIVIDDGSTDGSGVTCDQYAAKDARLRIIHQENRGLSAARNAGLDIMSGSAVAFLDADDAYSSDYIESMLSVMNRETVDIVTCKFALYHTTGKLGETEPESIKPKIQSGKYNRRNILQSLVNNELNYGIWNKLYSSSLWEEIRFPVGHVYEETDTTYRLFDLCENVYAIDKVLYMYRKHKGTITNTINKKTISDWLLARSHFEVYVEERVPSLFSTSQLNAIRQSRLRRMMQYYMIIRAKGEDDNDFAKELRGMILSLGKQIGRCSARMEICFWMIRFCPNVLKLLLPLCLTLGMVKY